MGFFSFDSEETGRMVGLRPEAPNILLTSVGRRTYMVSWFKRALAGSGKVHVTNSTALTPAFALADAVAVSPLIYSDEYIPFLLDYCRRNKIGALVPLFDIDVPVLAAHAADFVAQGCFPVVSDERTAQICNDKHETAAFLKRNGLASLKTCVTLEEALSAIRSGELTFPLMVKPRWGMGSKGVFEARDECELRMFYSLVQREAMESYLKYESAGDVERCVLIQQKAGGLEYGMDVFCDVDGAYRGCAVRKKIAMRAGETDVAQVVAPDARFTALALTLARELSFPGNLDVDVFENGEHLWVLEMNARFGGGYPFSHMAGADLPAALVAWLSGCEAPQDMLATNVEGIYMKDIAIRRIDMNTAGGGSSRLTILRGCPICESRKRAA